RRVESWRELIDAIDWSWVLKRVEELADELKPWIGPEGADDAEREGLMRKMFSELALLVHFAEARRGMDGGEWREERAKKLARAVEALSGGRIAGDHAERLAELIIRFAERREKSVKDSIDNLTEELAGVSREEVWGVVEFVLGDMYCLARDCARDAVVRKFVAPALELIMLDKALYNEFDREEVLLNFGEMHATAVAGDGTVGPKRVELAVGGELGGGAALLRLATLYLLNQLLPDGLKLGVRVYMGGGRYYNITATRENVARLKRLLAVSALSAGGEYLSPKFKRFVEAAKVEVWPGGIRLTESGCVAADLTFSEGGTAVKYNVYLRNAVELRFQSSERGRVELAALLLRLAGVSAEVKKVGDEGEWRVVATTDILAAGRKELRDAIARLVETARDNGWVNAEKAEHWLKKLEEGRVLKEGWPKYKVGLAEGALVVIFGSSNPDSIEREAQRLREVGLVGSRHFTVKMPDEGRYGYVSILKEGLAYAAWLSVHGSDKQRRLVAEFVEYILQRAKEKGEEVYEKAREIIEEGRARGSLRLEGFEGVVEVNGRKHVVKVIGWGAELEESWSGKKLLRIRITAEVDGVEGDYTITFSRRRADNAAVGRAYASADAPGGREADAERFSALVKALTDEEPRVYRMEGGRVMIECGREHLDGFKRYAELADAIEKWLEETRR
ncbi:MAG: PaRep2b protein, partial [Pyrobaculum sp.]